MSVLPPPPLSFSLSLSLGQRSVISFRRRDPDEDGDDIKFPESLSDLENTTYDNIPAEIILPSVLFRERRGPGRKCYWHDLVQCQL